MDDGSAESFRRDARVIGLVGVAHALSHFFQLALPPLFPLLRAEFDVSWTLLGSLMGVFYAASGITQFCAGFAVDRVGPRPVLLAGLSLLTAATLAAAAMPNVYALFPVVALAGIGNGVFHPADFAILNATVAQRRLGHAYSTHGIGGNLGYAVAPIVSFGLASALGWRAALVIMGAVGVVALVVLVAQRRHLGSPPAGGHAPVALRASAGLLLQVSILACFGYFVLQTIALTGVQTFGAGALNAGYAVPFVLGNSAITAYLLGSVAGILVGGFLASHLRHERVAVTGLLAGATLVALVTVLAPTAALLPLFFSIGFAVGSTGPSRDLIVRSATPKGASGRVYGFVYSGLDIGSTLAPIAFGVMLDQGLARGVFVVIALLLVVAVLTVVRVRRGMPGIRDQVSGIRCGSDTR